MWGSRGRALLRRSSLWAHQPPLRPPPPPTKTLIPLHPTIVSQSPSRLLSSSPQPLPPDAANPISEDPEPTQELPSPVSEQSLDPSSHFLDGQESANDGDAAAEIDEQQLEGVESLLRSPLEEPMETTMDKMEITTLGEEFVVRVIQTPDIPFQNVVDFYKWASRNDAAVRTPRVAELLVRAVADSEEFDKMVAYALWDLVKESGEEKGLLNTEILNALISMFSKLGKAKAGLEVFNKFEEFGCVPDGNSYYFTIKALGKRSMVEVAWSVCERMLGSGCLPDGEKIGEIITFFCRGKKAKEAHLVYLMAKENGIPSRRSSLESLITGLSKNDETVHLASELLEDYSGHSNKYANKTFAAVIKGLCRIKDIQEAKRLLIGMVDSGPLPGNAVFNSVITALSKGGEMGDAVALTKIMESRGLRPDVYTYSVIMSGFTKGGLMDEAQKVFDEAKKRHAKLSPVTYHILIRGYCKMEDFDKALDCLNEMKKDGVQPNTDEYNKMIQSLCLKALDWRAAERLLEEMKESGLYLPGITRSLVAAVKELEEGEMQLEETKMEA